MPRAAAALTSGDMRISIPFLSKPATVPVIRLQGVIGGSARNLSDAGLAASIERAFKAKPTAVALVINSPGGSPVQSSLIAARIRRLAQEKSVPVHAFVEDIAASGGYWLACAADHIWVDRSSLIGSIGVIFSSFGLPEFLARHGIERRVVTAGASKSLADPFLPQRPEDVERLRRLQDPIHRAFIDHVIARRGAALAADQDLFTGDIWTGERGIELGLADGLGQLTPKLRELYGEKLQLKPMGQRRGLLKRIGIEATEAALAGVEERAMWARFGL